MVRRWGGPRFDQFRNSKMLWFQFVFSAILLAFYSWSQMAIAIPNVTSLLSSLQKQVKREAMNMFFFLWEKSIFFQILLISHWPNSLTRCYRLHVCVPRKFIWDSVWRWDLWELIKFRWTFCYWKIIKTQPLVTTKLIRKALSLFPPL